MKIDLQSLGISTQELQDRVVQKVTNALLFDTGFDEDGDTTEDDSAFAEKTKALVLEKVDEAVNSIAAKHVVPNVEQYIANIVLQKTNSWGEKIGTPQTFVEYLIARVENWITEPVDYHGKPKNAGDSYNWKANGTRIAYMINEHIQYHINSAVKTALQDLNSNVAKGIADTVKIQLAQVLANVKIGVSVDR